MTLKETSIQALADRILAAKDAGASIAPISDAEPGFDLRDAYAVSAAVTRLRTARGERPVGWKVGFTNRTIWDEYGVGAPIWGPVYDTTTLAADPAVAIDCALGGLVEPRIEPEIVFRVASPPDPAMDERALLACVDGVAHGFEIVQSVYPNWKFKAADTVAAFALHGRLFHGPFTAIVDAAARERWLTALPGVEIVLSRGGNEVDRGRGANVLDSPLSALRHFLRELDRMTGERLKAGDVVTTGTVTRAFPVGPGEVWSTQVIGVPLPGLTIAFR